MKLKASIYNKILGDNTKLLFNAFSGALSEIDTETWKIFKKILNEPNKVIFNKEYSQMINQMVDNGYLVPEEYDEKEILKTRYFSEKFNPQYMGLAIVPTGGCNFDCVYCYEKDRGGVMSSEVERESIRFVHKKIQDDGVRVLDVTWYGGEPLLNFEAIESMSNDFITICKDQKVRYLARMVTNGFLLDSSKIEKLKDLGVIFLQITIDGPERIHNKRRPLKGGKGTFDMIVKNLLYASKYFKIAIRVNLDKDNYEYIDELLEYLCNLKLNENITIYSERAWGGFTCKSKDIEFNKIEFSNITTRFNMLAIKYKLKLDLPLILRDSYCVADKINGFLINYNGDILKCWEDLENNEEMLKMKLGTVKDGITNLNLFSKWLNLSPFEHSKCLGCEVLPLCMGGCPRARLHGEKLCEHVKSEYESYIRILRSQIIQGA